MTTKILALTDALGNLVRFVLMPGQRKWRHLIENFFQKLKEFKRIAMRSDKTDAGFSAIIYLAAAVINSR